VDNNIKKILETLSNQIDSNELTAAVKADNFEGEFAISDDGLSSILSQTKDLLTVDSAVANPIVVKKVNEESYPKHMKTALLKVEAPLKAIYEKLGIEVSSDEFVSDKISEIKDKIEAIEQSSAKGENKEVIDALNKELREARESLENKDSEFEQKLREKEEAFVQKSIRAKFDLKANQYNWADIYSDPDLKRALIEQKWNKINAKAHLKLDENGEILPMQKDMPEKELYLEGGNQVANLQTMLDQEFVNYTKKSAPEKVNKSPEQKTQGKDLSPQEQANLNEFNAQKRKFAESVR
jgi:hypothetical protein